MDIYILSGLILLAGGFYLQIVKDIDILGIILFIGGSLIGYILSSKSTKNQENNEDEIKETEKEINEKKSELKETESKIDEVNGDIKEAENKINEANQKIKEGESKNDDEKRSIEEARDIINSIDNSSDSNSNDKS